MDFWTQMDNLITFSRIIIDRHQGSTHPRYPECIYPLDYGYLENTSGGDGNEIDVWRGSKQDGLLVRVAVTVDVLKRDAEIKLLIDCTADDINQIQEFYNKSQYISGIIVRRNID